MCGGGGGEEGTRPVEDGGRELAHFWLSWLGSLVLCMFGFVDGLSMGIWGVFAGAIG